VSLRGLWERDPHMPPSRLFDVVQFDRPKPSFEVVLRVRGPSVAVEIEGEERFRYTMHDGSPIEGHVGFASSNGAYRVQTPTVQRHDLATGLAGVAAVGLDTERQPTVDSDGLIGLRTRGLPVGEDGTLVLWLPPVDADDEVGRKLPRALPVLAKFLSDRVEFPQPWVLAVPHGTPKARVAAIQELLAEHRKEPMPVVEHQVGPPLTGNPWVLFVDRAMVLRGAAQVGDPRLFSVVQRWARLLRAP